MSSASRCTRLARQLWAPSPARPQHQQRIATQLCFNARAYTSHTSPFLRHATRPVNSPKSGLRILQNGQTRSISIRGTGSVKENLKVLWRYHPYHLVGVTTISLTCVGILVGLNHYHATYFTKQFHKYPEPVAKQMRKAWYYTEIDLDPNSALKYYAKAIEAARELKMDPWSNEVLGIKESLIYMREKAGDITYATKLWEVLRADTLAQSEAALTLPDLDAAAAQQRRTRLLKRTVQISVKLAELYARPEVTNDAAAQELLTWAVTTVLRERSARSAAGATDASHGPWLGGEELGAALEALAHKYEAQNAHYLAAPLFLHALAAREVSDCHSVVLMGNLAACLALQSPPRERGVAVPERADMVRDGRQWADKALRLAAELAPPVRDEECDTGCVSVLYNLGEMAEMLKDRDEARGRYREALSLARGIGFSEGQEMAGQALKRLEGGR